MNVRRFPLPLRSTLAVVILVFTSTVSTQDASGNLCISLFDPAQKRQSPFVLKFEPASRESIIQAIATVPLDVLRGPVSEILRPAEALLRMQEDTPAKRMVVNQLNGLILQEGKRYTVEHSWAVAALGVRIGKVAGMKSDELVSLFYSGLAHDLGKAIVPNEVLNKPDRLTEAELDKMRYHAFALRLILEERAQGDPELHHYMEIGGDHHERWDGQGYPSKKPGPEIAHASRILGIADTFHAMISDRPYRAGMPFSKVLEILNKEIQSGQFEPELLQLVLNHVRKETN